MARSFERGTFYSNQRTLDLGKRSVHYVVMKPDNDPIGTVLLVPGIVTMLRGMSLFAHELTQHGFITVTMAHDTIDEECPDDVWGSAQAIRDGVLPGNGSHELKLTIMAHSLGAIHAVQGLVGKRDVHEVVDSAILMAPTGFGGVYPEHMVASLVDELRYRPITAYARDVTLEALRYTWRAKTKLIKKVNEARDVRVIEETRQLIHEDGVKVGAIRYPHDRLIDYDEVGAGLKEAGVCHSFDVVGEHTEHIGHNAHLLHPELVAGVAIDALHRITTRDCE